MSFIDKEQRVTSWQTKTKHNFIGTSVTSSFLSSFFPCRLELFCSIQRQTSLALTVATRPYICRLFLFFLPPRFVYISVSPNCSELAFVFGFSVKFASFLRHRPLVELLMLWKPTKSLKIYASLLIANSKSLLNIKSRRHPT